MLESTSAWPHCQGKPGLRNRERKKNWRTRPVQADADPTSNNSFVVSVVAVGLAYDQFVSKVLSKMDDTPDFTVASRF